MQVLSGITGGADSTDSAADDKSQQEKLDISYVRKFGKRKGDLLQMWLEMSS